MKQLKLASKSSWTRPELMLSPLIIKENNNRFNRVIWNNWLLNFIDRLQDNMGKNIEKNILMLFLKNKESKKIYTHV